MRHAPDNLIKKEPSAGGVGEGLVVESAVGASSSIGSNGAVVFICFVFFRFFSVKKTIYCLERRSWGLHRHDAASLMLASSVGRTEQPPGIRLRRRPDLVYRGTHVPVDELVRRWILPDRGHRGVLRHSFRHDLEPKSGTTSDPKHQSAPS